MKITQELLVSFANALLCVGLLIATFLLKNWNEIKNNDKKRLIWDKWPYETHSRAQSCKLHNQEVDGKISCDYCNETRRVPSLEMVIPSRVKFEILYNTRNKCPHFKTYIYPRYSSELYREKYETRFLILPL